MSLFAAFARTALAQHGKVVRAPTGIKRDKTGRVAKGSRRAFNKLMTDRYGKAVGRMTWSQIVETSSYQAANRTDMIDEASSEDADESY